MLRNQIPATTDAPYRCDEERTVDRFTMSNELAGVGNEGNHLENLSLLSNKKLVLSTDLHFIRSAASPATKNNFVRPFALKQGSLNRHALLMQH